MKQAFFRATILLPLGLLFYSFTEPVAFCVPEINLFLNSALSRFLIAMTTVLWLCCSPFRKSCCNGTWTEMLFNLVPVEFILMLCFAQWRFTISIVLTLLVIICEIALFHELRKDERNRKITKKRHRMYKAVFQRCTVLALSVFCVVPCLLTIFMFGLQSPSYRAEQEIWNILFSETDETADTDKDTDDCFRENRELWLCFKEEMWKKWSVTEKITIMQRFVDFETEKLGISSIPITADMIGEYTLGAYSNETNEMWINTEYLARSSASECIQTVCHETYHSYQYYLVSVLDWNNPALQTAYFEELHSWLLNQENYKSAWLYGFDEYENQPLEVSAREYAENEALIIMAYIRDANSSLKRK